MSTWGGTNAAIVLNSYEINDAYLIYIILNDKVLIHFIQWT